MARLNLAADGNNQKIVLAYLEENASDSLVDRINSGKKTMKDCWSYITSQARKMAVNNCACIEDKEVFGWAVHFFEEDDIKPETVKNEKKETNPETHEKYMKQLEAQHAKLKEEEEKKKAEKEAEKKAAEERKIREREDRKNVPGQLDFFSLLGGM